MMATIVDAASVVWDKTCRGGPVERRSRVQLWCLDGWKGEAASISFSGTALSERSEDILLRTVEAGEGFRGAAVPVALRGVTLVGHSFVPGEEPGDTTTNTEGEWEEIRWARERASIVMTHRTRDTERRSGVMLPSKKATGRER
jgi:hypothetical protein